MPRSFKVLLGAATALPILLVGYLLVQVLGVVIGISNRGGSVQQGWIEDLIREFFLVQITALGILVVLFAVYLWHLLVHRASRNGGEVVLWVVAMLFAPIFAMPVYWCTHVWPEKEPEPGRG